MLAVNPTSASVEHAVHTPVTVPDVNEMPTEQASIAQTLRAVLLGHRYTHNTMIGRQETALLLESDADVHPTLNELWGRLCDMRAHYMINTFESFIKREDHFSQRIRITTMLSSLLDLENVGLAYDHLLEKLVDHEKKVPRFDTHSPVH